MSEAPWLCVFPSCFWWEQIIREKGLDHTAQILPWGAWEKRGAAFPCTSVCWKRKEEQERNLGKFCPRAQNSNLCLCKWTIWYSLYRGQIPRASWGFPKSRWKFSKCYQQCPTDFRSWAALEWIKQLASNKCTKLLSFLLPPVFSWEFASLGQLGVYLCKKYVIHSPCQKRSE